MRTTGLVFLSAYRDIAALDVVAARLGAGFGPWEADTGVRDTLSPFHQVAQVARGGREAVLRRRSRLDWNYCRDGARALVALLAVSSGRDSALNIGPRFAFELQRFCEALADRYPGLRWRYGTDAEPNVDLHGSQNRAPLATGRLRATGVAPRFDEKAAYKDYLAWLEVL